MQQLPPPASPRAPTPCSSVISAASELAAAAGAHCAAARSAGSAVAGPRTHTRRTHADALGRLDAINRGFDRFVLPSRAHATVVGNASTVAAGVVRTVLCGGFAS